MACLICMCLNTLKDRKDSGTDYIKGLLQGWGGGSVRKVLASQTPGPEFESQSPGEKAVWDAECNLRAGTVGWAHQTANLAESSNSKNQGRCT